MKETTKRVVQRLKEVKAQKDLTCQDIVDACEAQGESVSLSTVRRIFARGNEDGADFRPYTINAIFRAVIGTEDVALPAAEEATLTDTGKEVLAENAALKAVVEMYNVSMEDLQRQNELLRNENNALQHTISDMQIKLDTTIDLFRLAMESLGKSSH